MLNEGLALMLTGMGTVFSFLVILWLSVSYMGKIVMKLNEIFPEKVETVKAVAKSVNSDAEIAIAIAAAKYRN